MKKKKALIMGLVVVLVGGMVVLTGSASGIRDILGGNAQETVTISKDEYDRLMRFKKLDTILGYMEDLYIEDVDVDAMIDGAAQGLLLSLEDPYTFYYNAEDWSSMKEDDEGVYAGIGIQMLGSVEDNTVRITRVFKGSPAEAEGFRKGDLLVRVEDVEVNFYTMQSAVNIMRGVVGESVEVEVKRGDEYITFHPVRAVIHVNRVEYTMLEDQVGLLALYEFQGESEKEFADALADLEAQGAKALIVDLRDNPGGWVQSAEKIGDLFLDDGLLIYSEDRYGNRDEARMRKGSDPIPLVFLINENSASSSEILSGGLWDRGRATLVGVPTYGKGIMQVVIDLDNDTTGFQMTYQQYYLPSGQKVHKVGLTPDVIVEMPEELVNAVFDMGDMNDPQLQKAWETAKELIQ